MPGVGIGISRNSEWSQHYIKRTPEEQGIAQSQHNDTGNHSVGGDRINAEILIADFSLLEIVFPHIMSCRYYKNISRFN